MNLLDENYYQKYLKYKKKYLDLKQRGGEVVEIILQDNIKTYTKSIIQKGDIIIDSGISYIFCSKLNNKEFKFVKCLNKCDKKMCDNKKEEYITYTPKQLQKCTKGTFKNNKLSKSTNFTFYDNNLAINLIKFLEYKIITDKEIIKEIRIISNKSDLPIIILNNHKINKKDFFLFNKDTNFNSLLNNRTFELAEDEQDFLAIDGPTDNEPFPIKEKEDLLTNLKIFCDNIKDPIYDASDKFDKKEYPIYDFPETRKTPKMPHPRLLFATQTANANLKKKREDIEYNDQIKRGYILLLYILNMEIPKNPKSQNDTISKIINKELTEELKLKYVDLNKKNLCRYKNLYNYYDEEKYKKHIDDLKKADDLIYTIILK